MIGTAIIKIKQLTRQLNRNGKVLYINSYVYSTQYGDAKLHIQVKVVEGNDKGQTGQLISIDGFDRIVRMDRDKQLKIFEMKSLTSIPAK